MEERKIEHKDMEIDLVKIFKMILEDKNRMLIYCGIAGFIGLIIAFSLPKNYKTEVMLAPESSGSGFSSSISSIASMVGMDMKTGAGDDAIFPELYPDLMASMDFLTSLFPIKVNSIDGRINTTYYNYIKQYQKTSWWNYPQIWIMQLLNNESMSNHVANNKVNPFKLTKEQYGIAMAIKGNIKCSVDKKTEIITINVTAQDPLISATMADSVKMRLQAFITDYRTNKARNDLAYMEKLFRETQMEYAKARQVYGSYADANTDLMLESFKAKKEDLENEMQLKYNIYTQVAQQLQIAKAKVQERTPAFTVIQSASVPLNKSNTPKSVILFVFVVIGFITRFSILLYNTHKEK